MQLIFIRLNNVKAMLSLERDIFYNLYSGQRYEIINELDLGKINFKDGQSIFSRVAVPVISTFIVPFVSGYKTMSSLNSRLNKSVNNFFIKGFLYIPCLAISVIRTLISCVFSVLYLPAILFAKSTTTYDYESSEEGGWEEGLSSHKCLATPPAKVSPPQRGDDDTAVIQFMKSIGLSADYTNIINDEGIDGNAFCDKNQREWIGLGVSADDAAEIFARGSNWNEDHVYLFIPVLNASNLTNDRIGACLINLRDKDISWERFKDMDENELQFILGSMDDAKNICDIKSQRLYRSKRLFDFLDIAIEMQDDGKDLPKCMVTRVPDEAPEGIRLNEGSECYIREGESIEGFIFESCGNSCTTHIVFSSNEDFDSVLNKIIKKKAANKELTIELKEVITKDGEPAVHIREIKISF